MQNLPLVATKMQPHVSAVQILRRPRLLGSHSPRLTYVVSPAGTGKSTLFTDRDGAWLHLHSSDSDLGTFLLYFTETLARRYPGCCEGARDQLLARAPLSGLPAGLANQFVNQISDYGRPVEIILDDLHLCYTSAIGEWLDFLLRRAPANLTLVAVTRHHLELPLAWLRPRGLLRQIEEPELAFTPDETRQLVCEVWKLPLPETLVEALWSKTRGWVTALQLCTQALSAMPVVQWAGYLEALSGAQTEIYEYLASEVFRSLPTHIQHFVMTTSCVEEWNPALAAVLSEQDVTECSAYLHKHRLFLQKVGPDTFRYHPLFREFLLDILKLGPEYARLHHRAAAYWLEQGQPLKALELYEALQDHSAIQDVLERYGLELILQGQNQLDRYLQQISTAARAGSAPLSLLCGILSELRTDWEESERHFKRALALSQSDLPALSRAWAHLCQGYLKCDRHAELLDVCCRGLDQQPGPAVMVQLLCWRGLTLIQTGRDWAQGYRDIVEAHRLLGDIDDPHARYASALAYGFVYLFGTAQVKAALTFLASVSDEFMLRQMPLPAYSLNMNRAVILLLCGDSQRAMRLVDETLLESKRSRHLFVFQGLETLKILIRLEQDAANTDVWQRLELDGLSPQFRPYLLAGLLRYHCRHRALEMAAATAARLTEQLAATPDGFYALECNLALAQYHQSRGDGACAAGFLQANLRLCQLAGASHYEVRTRRLLDLPHDPVADAQPILRIQSLGALRIYHQEKALDLSQGFYRITLLILKLLLAAGDRVVSLEQIVDVVWSEQPPDSARRVLTVHMSNLRKALKVPQAIVRLGDGYRLNHGPHLQVDSVAFQKACQQAALLTRQGDEAGARMARSQAEELWKGPFLAEEHYLELALERRKELDEEYSRLPKVGI